MWRFGSQHDAHPPLDVPTLLGQRFESGDDESTVGFYDRQSRGFRVVTQRQFLDQAAGAAACLTDGGASVGDHVMIAATSPELLWRGFVGSVLAGAIPVLLPVRPSLDDAAEIAAKLDSAVTAVPDARLFVQSGRNGPCIDTGGRRFIDLDPDAPAADAMACVAATVGEPARHHHLQFTSGSTGAIKPVVMTHTNVISSTWSLARRMEAQPGDHVVSWLPLYHDMGLIGMAMLSLTSGANLRLLSPFDFLSDPSHWLEAISNGPGAITAAPNFAFDYTTRRAPSERVERLDLSTWKKCYCGAEPVDSATISAFIDRFEKVGLRAEAVQPTYGLAEATLMVTMPFTGDTPHQLQITLASISSDGPVEVLDTTPLAGYAASLNAATTSVVCLGAPAEEMIVEITDSSGNVVEEENYGGEVVVSGPATTPGYLRPDGTIEQFPDNRCPTGDIGFMHHGELYVVERIKNIIIKHGQNYSAAAIERTIAEQSSLPLDNCAVIETSITGTGAEIVAVIEPPRRADPDEVCRLALEVVRQNELPLDEVVVVSRSGIPRTTSGKKQHARLRAALRSGELKILRRSGLRPLIGPDSLGIIHIDEIDESARMLALIQHHARRHGWTGEHIEEGQLLVGDLGLDSLALIELSVDLEHEIGRGIPESRLGEVHTVADVLRLATDQSSTEPRLTDVLTRLVEQIPQVYRRVDLQVARQLRIDGRWITDFASLNYLGLDLHSDVLAAVTPAVQEWGVHPSWTRAVASPSLYFDLERAIADLVGAPDVMVFSTITLLHFGVLPKLATASDTVVVDRTAHNSVHEAAELATARGASLRHFDHNDLATLERALEGARGRPVVAMNGVYSMTGSLADLRRIHEMATAHGALIYIDDAHGFGILGPNPDSTNPYGEGGGGAVAHVGLDYDNIVYVAGLSKAFSSMAAFVTCRDRADRVLFESASTSIFSGPIPVASMASAIAALGVNAIEGDERRRTIHALTDRLIRGARERGYAFDNHLSFPIVNLVIGDGPRVVRASRILWDRGILFTPSVFPAAPLNQGGFRVSVTADNTDAEVDQLLAALDSVEAELGPPPAPIRGELIREI